MCIWLFVLVVMVARFWVGLFIPFLHVRFRARSLAWRKQISVSKIWAFNRLFIGKENA